MVMAGMTEIRKTRQAAQFGEVKTRNGGTGVGGGEGIMMKW